MAPQYKLTYFNLGAVAEPIRFILKYGGIEFEDERLEISDWPALKERFSFGQVPVLTVNGKQYNQSLALARFFAKKVKLNGKDEWEDLEIDGIVDTIADVRLRLAQYHYEKDETIKESLRKPLHEEIIPFYMERLDKIAKENGGYLACKRLTWVDLVFVSFLDYFNSMAKMDVTAKYPNLEKLKQNILSIPAIKEWVNTRPKTVY